MVINMNRRFYLFILFCVLISGTISCSKLPGLIGHENMETIEYNGELYKAKDFYCFDDDRVFLGYADNGAKVYTVGDKSDPIYLMIVGEDNTGCYIKEGCSVPISGAITKVLIDPGIREINTQALSKEEELKVAAEITKITGETREYTVDNYYTNGNSFYYVFNGSNVSSEENYGGYIACVNGTWIYSAPDNKIEWKENNTVIVSAVVIDNPDLVGRMCKTALAKRIVN